MLHFADVLSLTGDIYGNENVLLCKLGRLLIVYDKGIIKCYAINSSDIPVAPYVVQKLTDECLAGSQKCSDAFGIHNKSALSSEPDVTFSVRVDGACDITFNIDPIEIKEGLGFYNLLVGQLSKEEDHFTIFKDMVEIKSKNDSRVKVFVYKDKPPPPAGHRFNVIIHIDTAGCLLDSIPYFWDVFYDTSDIKYDPTLFKLSNLRPLS